MHCIKTIVLWLWSPLSYHHHHLRAAVITCLCWRSSTPWRCRVRLPVKNLADGQSSSVLSVYEGKIWHRNSKCSPKTVFSHLPNLSITVTVCSEPRVITSAFDELSLNRLRKTVFLSVLKDDRSGPQKESWIRERGNVVFLRTPEITYQTTRRHKKDLDHQKHR